MTAALVCGELRRDGEQVAQRGLRLAGGLARMGIEDGDVIAVMLRNGPAFIDAILSCQTAGCFYCPINWHFKGDEVAAINALPDLSQPPAGSARATGTDGKPTDDTPQLPPRLKPNQRGREPARSGATGRDDDDQCGHTAGTADDQRKPRCTAPARKRGMPQHHR